MHTQLACMRICLCAELPRRSHVAVLMPVLPDYVVKCLLGAIDPEFDALDERKLNGCCSVQ